jgi:hypothetical protein
LRRLGYLAHWSMFATPDWKIRILSTALAVMLCLIWFYATIHASRSPKKIQTEAATPLIRLAAQRGGEIMPDGDTTISALYKVFEQAVTSYLAIPSAVMQARPGPRIFSGAGATNLGQQRCDQHSA